MKFFDWLFGHWRAMRQPASVRKASTQKFAFRTWPLVRMEAITNPLFGLESSVPWSNPLSSNAQVHTYWGVGPATTGLMTTNDASLRVVAEKAPLSIRVMRMDGGIKDDIVLNLPDCFGMAQLLDQGKFCLEVHTDGAWGITVVTAATTKPVENPVQALLGTGGVAGASPQMIDPEQRFSHARRLAGNLSQLPPSSDPAPNGLSVLLLEDRWFWGGPTVVIVSSSDCLVCFPSHKSDRASMLPKDPSLNIAVISFTEYDGLLEDLNGMIPILGYLSEFSGQGHRVWVFGGALTDLEAGCRDADLLLVDSEKLPHLPSGWQEMASRTMRGRELWVHDRDRCALTKTTVGFFDYQPDQSGKLDHASGNWSFGSHTAASASRTGIQIMNKERIIPYHKPTLATTLVPEFDEDGQPMGVFKPHMPSVSPEADINRLANFDDKSKQSVVIQISDGETQSLQINPAILTDAMLQFAESVLPAEPPRTIVVLAFTDASPFKSAPNVCIPFLFTLTLLAKIGHAVRIFEGQADRFAKGVRDADVLVVDWGIMHDLQDDWQKVARQEMQGEKLWLYDRERHKFVKTVLGNIRIVSKGLILMSDRENISLVDLPPISRQVP